MLPHRGLGWHVQGFKRWYAHMQMRARMVAASVGGVWGKGRGNTVLGTLWAVIALLIDPAEVRGSTDAEVAGMCMRLWMP